MFCELSWDNENRYVEKNIWSNNYALIEGDVFIKAGTSVSSVFYSRYTGDWLS